MMNYEWTRFKLFSTRAAAWRLRITPKLFQNQNGSDDNDSQGLWWTSSSSLSSGRWADWKVSNSAFIRTYLFTWMTNIFRSILEYQNQAKRLFKTLSDNSPQRCSIETGNGQYIFQWVIINFSAELKFVLLAVTSLSSRPVSSPWLRCTSARRPPMTSSMI